jgi:hypothetical protein
MSDDMDAAADIPSLFEYKSITKHPKDQNLARLRKTADSTDAGT